MLKTSRTAHEIAIKPVMFPLPYLHRNHKTKEMEKTIDHLSNENSTPNSLSVFQPLRKYSTPFRPLSSIQQYKAEKQFHSSPNPKDR
jgi:hypothetical protein